jgi:hypothetical protein
MMRKMIAAFVLVVALFSPAHAADQAVLSWDNPLNRTDNSLFDPTKEISSFKIYHGVTNPPTLVTTVPVTTSYPALFTGQTYTITNLSNATTYYFQVSVVDQNNTEGGKTGVISKTTLSPAPAGGCTNFRVR